MLLPNLLLWRFLSYFSKEEILTCSFMAELKPEGCRPASPPTWSMTAQIWSCFGMGQFKKQKPGVTKSLHVGVLMNMCNSAEEDRKWLWHCSKAGQWHKFRWPAQSHSNWVWQQQLILEVHGMLHIPDALDWEKGLTWDQIHSMHVDLRDENNPDSSV